MFPEEVKLVIKHLPLRMHKYALKAARAALAANSQGKFWELHQELFKNYQTINEGKIQEIAETLGLDMDQFKKDMNSPDVVRMISRDIQNGRQAEVHGTPTVFINGKRLRNRKLPGFVKMIKEELKKK